MLSVEDEDEIEIEPAEEPVAEDEVEIEFPAEDVAENFEDDALKSPDCVALRRAQ